MSSSSNNSNSTIEQNCQNGEMRGSTVSRSHESDAMDVDNEGNSNKNDTGRETPHGREFGTENCSASASVVVVDGSNNCLSRPTMLTGNALLRSYFEQVYDTTPSSEDSPKGNTNFCHHNVQEDSGEGPSCRNNPEQMNYQEDLLPQHYPSNSTGQPIQNVYPIDNAAQAGHQVEMNPNYEFGQAGERIVPVVQNEDQQNNNVDVGRRVVPPAYAYIEVQDANQQVRREEFIQIQDGDRIVYGGIVGREEQHQQLVQRNQELIEERDRLLLDIRRYQYLRYMRRNPNEARIQDEILNLVFPAQQPRAVPNIQPFPPGAAPGHILMNGAEMQMDGNNHLVEIEVRRRRRVVRPQRVNGVRLFRQEDFDDDEVARMHPPGDRRPEPGRRRHLHQYTIPPEPQFCITCGYFRQEGDPPQ